MSEDTDKPVHDHQQDDEGLSKVTNFLKERIGKTDAQTWYYDAVEEFVDDKGK